VLSQQSLRNPKSHVRQYVSTATQCRAYCLLSSITEARHHCKQNFFSALGSHLSGKARSCGWIAHVGSFRLLAGIADPLQGAEHFRDKRHALLRITKAAAW